MELPFRIDLSGKTAVVTGGGGVLCSVMAKALAECGASVAVLSRHEESSARVADEITSAGGKAVSFAADVLSRTDMEAARDYINGIFGPCDILINGAGGNSPKGTTASEYLYWEDVDSETRTFFDLDPDGIRDVLELNYLGTLIPAQVFALGMKERKTPVIINISSMNSFRPLTKIPAYSGAKAAVSNLTMWLAVHFSKVGIRVNAIAPGFFLTGQNRTLLENPDGSLTERSNKIIGHTPMGRFGKPEELIGTLLWLCDAKASGFVTGIVVPVDGGFSAYSGV